MCDYMHPITPKTTIVLRDGETNEVVWQGPLWEFARDNGYDVQVLMFLFASADDATCTFGGGASHIMVATAIV